MTTAIIAALDYGGNLEKARRMLQTEGYIPNMLGKSRFNRRWHRNANLFLTLFSLLGETWKQLNSNSIYVIDSFPVAACDNYRIQFEFFLTSGNYSDASALKLYHFDLPEGTKLTGDKAYNDYDVEALIT